MLAIYLVSYSQSQSEIDQASKYSYELYKQLHQHPELGKQEYKTAELIQKELKNIGFTQFYTVSGLPTCVIAELDTRKSGDAVALRAEMDARPGKEHTGLPFASKDSTATHSCGHDAHTAMLLGAAKLLFQYKKKLKGKIFFVFQPAEETSGGADDIVKSGILDSLKVKRIFALHGLSGVPVGTTTISPGYTMAGSNYFTISIKGKGSHAATPFAGSNLPLLTSRIVEALAAIPAAKMNISQRPCVISTTYMELGSKNALNVLADTCTIAGTIRAYEHIDYDFRGEPSIQTLVTQTVTALCQAEQATCVVDIRKSSPPTFIDNDLFDTTVWKLRKTFSGTIDTTPTRRMFSEDFSHYTSRYPCLYFALGIAKDDFGFEGLHSNTFTIHPDAFPYGIELFCDLIFIDNAN